MLYVLKLSNVLASGNYTVPASKSYNCPSRTRINTRYLSRPSAALSSCSRGTWPLARSAAHHSPRFSTRM